METVKLKYGSQGNLHACALPLPGGTCVNAWFAEIISPWPLFAVAVFGAWPLNLWIGNLIGLDYDHGTRSSRHSYINDHRHKDIYSRLSLSINEWYMRHDMCIVIRSVIPTCLVILSYCLFILMMLDSILEFYMLETYLMAAWQPKAMPMRWHSLLHKYTRPYWFLILLIMF